MPPKRVGGRTGPQLPVELQEELGMDDRRRGGKRKAAPLSRKEQRKQARQMKKQRKVGSAYTSSAAPEVRSVTPASGERATANRPAKGQKRPKRSEFGGNPLFEKLLQDSQLLPGGTTPEDEEIAYLERKLGLAKGSQKARGKKQAEFDRSLRSIGLGALSTLLSDLDGPAPARGGAAGESEDEMGSDSDAEASSGVEASGDAEASSDVEAASGAEAETDTGRAGSGTAAARAATPKRDLYGRDLPARCAAGAYVPPHMRAAAGGRSEAFMRLQRQVRGLLNRLGEANVEPVAMELAQLYRQHSRNDMNTILWEAVAALAVGRQQLQVAFIRVFAALVAGLHILVGVEVGAHVLERAVLHFLDCYTVAKAGEGGDKRPANALLLVVFLYAHSLVHCSLVLELVRSLVASFTELDVELLLLVMKYSGFLLRSDDPAALRDVVREAQDRAKALVAQQAGGATGDAGVCAHAAAADAAGVVLGVDDLPAGLTTRLRFMLDTITDLKNNRKRRHHEELDEREKRLRTWVQRTRQRHSGSGGAAAVLRVGVADLQQAEERGRWWLPGARWVQGSGPVGAGGERSQADDEEQEQLLELAKSQRMNTGVRRSVFCVVMSAEDYTDAFERLLQLNLRDKDEREIVRVLLECCGQEDSYNPYYALLAQKLCEHEQRFRFTFQLCFWDMFKIVRELHTRKAANLARLLAHLVSSLALGWVVLKPVELHLLTPRDALFFRIFFTAVLKACDADRVMVVFKRVALVKEHAELRDSIVVFLKAQVKPALAGDADMAAKCKQAVQCLKRLALLTL